MEFNVVYFKDARQMKEVDDQSISLIVTSPPYWNVKDYALDGYQREQRHARIEGQIGDIEDYQEYLQAMNEVWKECERVLKPNGKLCVNAPIMPIPKKIRNTDYTRYIVNIYSGIETEILTRTNLKLLDVYIWERANPTKRLMFGSYPYPPNFYAQNTSEFIGVFVKDGEPEKKPPEIKEASKLTEEEWVNYTKQVWRIPIPRAGDEAYGSHPAIMPLELAERLIKLYSFVEDIVLDPFIGSGTTAKAAQNLRRRYIGYEIDPSYKDIIERKLAQQLALFRLTPDGPEVAYGESLR
ncbi:site-specific DNA-methyltransferase [candidate division NPL-UPA2 bacterium]|nr:site-specific DNA-methyltransferase [candidate division NPL-UPA2 bacterium]